MHTKFWENVGKTDSLIQNITTIVFLRCDIVDILN